MVFKNNLAEVETILVENVKGEDREMKTISKHMVKLEEEIANSSERSTKKYKTSRQG